MPRELAGLKATGTFEAAHEPENRKAVRSKWVFKWKTDQSGHVVKAKATLVAKGFNQVEGINYLQTSAPTPVSASGKFLAAIACEEALDIYHFGAEQGFVQSQLEDEI